MTLDLHKLALLGILCAAIHWLVARSNIAQPLWSRARGKLDELLRCPSCSGFWLGGGLAAAGVRPLGGIHLWAQIVAGGLFGVALTPVVQAVVLWGLERTAMDRAVADHYQVELQTAETLLREIARPNGILCRHCGQSLAECDADQDTEVCPGKLARGFVG